MTAPSETRVYTAEDRLTRALFDHNSPSAVRNMKKEYREGPIEALRGHMSTDREFLTFKDNLSRRLTREFPATVDELGRVSGNGVRSNFYGLRYVGGYPQIPATYPLVDNTHLREKNGLSNKWTKTWHEVCARALTRLFFTELEPVPVKIRATSSSMMPFYSSNITQKLELARHSISFGKNSGELMLKGDYTTPWREFFVGGAYHTVYRRQASDRVTFEDGTFAAAKRPVADLDFAISGGRKGTFEPADRALVDMDFHVPTGFFRERNRTAMGGPLGLNANLMVIAQSVRSHIYNEYAFTYHHTTRTSQEEETRKMGFVLAADVSNHDWYWPTFVIDTVADELLKLGYAEWWVELYRVRMRLPNYVTDVAPGEGNVLLGDWTKPTNKGGLPSGNAFTDLDGCWLMTLVYFIMQVEHTYPEVIKSLHDPAFAEQFLRKYLRGEAPIALKDKSDDALLGWPDPYLHGRAKALQKKMQDGEQVSPYMLVSYEHGGAFLGSILLYPRSGDHKGLTFIGNINSLVTNMFSPEYGVQSRISDRTKARRPYAGLAWKTLSQNYGSSPIYSEVLDIIEYEWAKVYGESYRAYRNQWLYDDERALRQDLASRSLKNPDLDPISLEVLMDPGKLSWKYDSSAVAQEVVDMMFNGLDLGFIQPFFEEIYPNV